MLKIIRAADCRKEDILTREVKEDLCVETVVRGIVSDVRTRGDAALYEYTLKFDKADLRSFEVSEKEIKAGCAAVDGEFKKTLRIAAANIRQYHKKQIQKGYEIKRSDGSVLGRTVTPIERAGVYVPGGTAAYPSTVLMDVIPAVVAGVPEIYMATPPGRDGKIKDEILAAAKIAGVTKIFKMGGAQAIAAFAYGTDSVPKVDKIVGPGNIYVATAKKQVFGAVDIDMFAGPSEILVIADGDNDPSLIAIDLLSQAEHDVLASSVLVTDSVRLAELVQSAVETLIPTLKRADIARKSIDDNGKIIIVGNINEAVAISNEIAPEHLELLVKEPFKVLKSVKNAGSVFLGQYSPEALGDYMAGTNHTLPTSGTARFSSPLSVDDFVKKSSYMFYTKDALEGLKDRVVDFAEREGLEAHARSVSFRFRK
ncbi:MAG: histidinol dehydrogenase [Clostridiaceae bacterium]|jgi:histidinol dehydrogenase|nr:histidinol dehydrogenase [Clostridiaceae bacterium]